MTHPESSRDRLAALSPAQRQRILERLRTKKLAQRTPLVREPHRGRPVAASFQQQRMFLHEQLNPGVPAYHMPLVVRLRGPWQADLIEFAINHLVARHEVLRTVYSADGAGCWQRILDAVHIELPYRRVHPGKGLSVEEAARAAAQTWILEPFDLERGPPLRALILALGPAEHLLVLALHHIAADGWSLGIIAQEIAEVYLSRIEKREPRLPDLPVQYADYARWQNAALGSGQFDSSIAHWRAELDGAPSEVSLPIDSVEKPGEQRSDRLPWRLEAREWRAVQACAERLQTTPYVVLASAFKALLARYTGQPDVILGCPVANRSLSEVLGNVGLFVNNLILRTRVTPHQSFESLVASVRLTAARAWEHQALPLEKVAEVASTSGPLLKVVHVRSMLVLQNTPFPNIELEGLEFEGVEIGTGATDHDLVLSLREQEGALVGDFHFRATLWGQQTASRWLEAYHSLLLEACLSPRESLARLTSPGAQQLEALTRWQGSTVERGDADNVVTRFRQRVAEAPAAQAMRSGKESLTYGELDRHSEQLARELIQNGITQESVVAVQLERSFQMVVALLGILKAGAAYLPLEPDWPERRVAKVLESAACPIMLVRAEAPDAVKPRIRVLRVGASRDRASGHESHMRDVLAQQACYVIYTSGSTGQPKGVVNTHQALLNRLLWKQSTFPIRAGDRVLFKTPYTFDVSVWEVFWPLICGATIVLSGPGGHREPDYMARLIAEEGVDVCHFVPSMLGPFLDAVQRAPAPDKLRTLITSGEALSPALVRRVWSILPRCQLFNLYGPTEAAIDVSCWSAIPTAELTVVPIGVPIENTKLWVLDEDMDLQPIGVWGELFIGGMGVARGYLGDGRQTAERFVPDLFSGPGHRLYRTGDRARWRPEGTLEFGGRLDHQVKLRGQRIELGEIETRLQSLEGVAAAASALVPRSQDSEILAWVVPCPGAKLDARELRSQLRRELPDAMLPSEVYFLDALPQTDNGKLDRRRLTEPNRSGGARSAARMPRTALERELAELWSAVLGRDVPALGESFFEVGGHSLLLIRLAARIDEQLGHSIPLRWMYDAPTIEGIAAALVAAALQQRFPELDPAQLEALEALSPEALESQLRSSPTGMDV